MNDIPKHIRKIVDYQSDKLWRNHSYFIRRFADIEDIKQEIYFVLYSKNLINKGKAIIHIASYRAGLDFVRKNIRGFRQRRKDKSKFTFTFYSMEDIFIIFDDYEKMFDNISINNMLEKLPLTQRYILQQRLNGFKLIEIANQLETTKQRIDQIEKDGIGNLKRLYANKAIRKKQKSKSKIADKIRRIYGI